MSIPQRAALPAVPARARATVRRAVVAPLGVGLLAAVLVAVPASPALAATWTVVTTPNPAAGLNRLAGADALGTSIVWAVGATQSDWNTPTRPLAARWNGSAWSAVTTPALSGSAELSAVDGNAGSNVWAVGTVGTRGLTERWNGTSWSVATNPMPAGATSATLRGVKTLATNDAWAVGHYRTTTNPHVRTLILRWNGTAWSQVPTPNPDPNQNVLVAVGGVAANDLWAAGNVGHDGYGGDTVATLMLRWNGTSWRTVPLPGGNGSSTGFSIRKLHDMVVLASNNVWAVGTAFSWQTFTFVPYWVRWNGSSWQEGTIPSPGMGDFHAVTALSSTKVYAFGTENGNPVIARWNGTAWSRETAPASSGTLLDATVAGTATVWAVGSRTDSNGNSRTVAIRTTNG